MFYNSSTDSCRHFISVFDSFFFLHHRCEIIQTSMCSIGCYFSSLFSFTSCIIWHQFKWKPLSTLRVIDVNTNCFYTPYKYIHWICRLSTNEFVQFCQFSQQMEFFYDSTFTMNSWFICTRCKICKFIAKLFFKIKPCKATDVIANVYARGEEKKVL